MDMKNKVVLVTGASSGIGLAVAKCFAEKGAKVVMAARSKEKLERLSNEIKGSFPIAADMMIEEDIKEMIGQAQKHFGRIDILVNNAGQGYDAPIEKIDIRTYQDLFYLDVVAPIIAMQQVIPIMRSHGGGDIVNISSGTALMSLENMGAYSSLKRALVGISLTAREELKKDKINVCVVYPYITLTDFEKNTIKSSAREDKNDPGTETRVRFPPDTPEYIANIILKGIGDNDAEIFAHDWMNNLGRQ